MNDLPAPTSRARHGRWLGGVCAGLAARWDVPPARVRLGFVLGALALGLGVLVYLAAWLILPVANEDGTSSGQRGIVLLAQACGALLGLATLAVAGAAATVFGFGWVVVALAAAVLVGTLAGWARLGPAWALLPIGALVLPSVALAVGGLRVEPSSTSVVLTPRTLAELPRDRLTSGLGLLTLDLRRTALPEAGRIPLRIEAGVRRTLIALPHDRCVHVVVRQREGPAALRVGAAFLGEAELGTPETRVFGRLESEDRGRADRADTRGRLLVDGRRAGGARLSGRRRTRPTSPTGRATRSSSRSARTPPGSRARRPSGGCATGARAARRRSATSAGSTS